MITILFAKPERGIKRYFTPTTEVPICGHATIAAHYVRAIEDSYLQAVGFKRQRRGFCQLILKRMRQEITAPFAPKIQIFGQAVM